MKNCLSEKISNWQNFAVVISLAIRLQKNWYINKSWFTYYKHGWGIKISFMIVEPPYLFFARYCLRCAWSRRITFIEVLNCSYKWCVCNSDRVLCKAGFTWYVLNMFKIYLLKHIVWTLLNILSTMWYWMLQEKIQAFVLIMLFLWFL